MTFFLFVDGGMIVEMHGLQHYEESTLTRRSLQEEQSNDELKQRYAINRGVKEYIVIDCRYSKLSYIKNNILKSRLADMFDLSKIDWNKCELYASGSMVTLAADLYNDNVKFNDIMKKLSASKSAVTMWLNKADSIGLICWEKHNGFKDLCKKTILLNTNEVFESASKGAKAYNVSPGNVRAVCNHKRNYAGRHPDTGEPLVWMFWDEYILKQKTT